MLKFRDNVVGLLFSVLLNQLLRTLDNLCLQVLQCGQHELTRFLAIMLRTLLHVVKQLVSVFVLYVILGLCAKKASVFLKLKHLRDKQRRLVTFKHRLRR